MFAKVRLLLRWRWRICMRWHMGSKLQRSHLASLCFLYILDFQIFFYHRTFVAIQFHDDFWWECWENDLAWRCWCNYFGWGCWHHDFKWRCWNNCHGRRGWWQVVVHTPNKSTHQQTDATSHQTASCPTDQGMPMVKQSFYTSVTLRRFHNPILIQLYRHLELKRPSALIIGLQGYV